jgi:hypothetical protein
VRNLARAIGARNAAALFGSASLHRLRDYLGFIVWFAGLGYIVIWPLAASGNGGLPFGAAVLCTGVTSGVLELLCHSVHPSALPLPFHVLGALSVIAISFKVLHYGLSRAWRGHAGVARLAATRAPGAAAAPLPPSVLRSLPRVKPRSHFGLRGARQ